MKEGHRDSTFRESAFRKSRDQKVARLSRETKTHEILNRKVPKSLQITRRRQVSKIFFLFC
jgi:hypothetical protein